MAKLVLDIKPRVIKQAKDYADHIHADLSALVEDFLENISNVEKQKVDVSDKIMNMEVSDWVKQLVIVDKPTPDSDTKAEYREHIIKKYS